MISTLSVQRILEGANSLLEELTAFYLSNPRTLFAIVVFTCFFFYYHHCVVQKPLLFSAEGRFRWFVKANCPSISQAYWPTIWCYETHLLTTISTFLRGLSPLLSYHRFARHNRLIKQMQTRQLISGYYILLFSEYVRCPDGGQISLDWYDPDSSARGNDNRLRFWQWSEKIRQDCDSPSARSCSSTVHSASSRAIALFLPGLTGCSQAEYIKTMVPIAHSIGYRAVCINYRGLGNTRLLTPRLYCATSDEDLETALLHIRNCNPDAKIVVTGISMGGIILARYLIKAGDDALLDAAFLVSVCFNFMEVVDSMERGLNYPVNQLLTKALINIVLEHREWFQDKPEFDIDAITRCKNIREFDAQFTIKMFNFASPNDYYRESSHKGKLTCIKKPTLCINAADDMFAPAQTLPVDEIRASSHVAILVTARGGHIGFMDSLLPLRRHSTSYYSERVLHEYLRALYDVRDINRDLC